MTQETHHDVTHRHVDVRAAKRRRICCWGLFSVEGSVGKERSGAVCKAYGMSFTFETFHVLKSPLKALALQKISLGGREEGCAESDGEE